MSYCNGHVRILHILFSSCSLVTFGALIVYVPFGKSYVRCDIYFISDHRSDDMVELGEQGIYCKIHLIRLQPRISSAGR